MYFIYLLNPNNINVFFTESSYLMITLFLKHILVEFSSVYMFNQQLQCDNGNVFKD